MFQEMFSVLTGDMGTDEAQEGEVDQPREGLDSPKTRGGDETTSETGPPWPHGEEHPTTFSPEELEKGRQSSAEGHGAGEGGEAAAPGLRDAEGDAGRSERAGQRQPLPLVEVPHSSGERSGPELSFGLSDSAAPERDAGAHASTADRQQPWEGGPPETGHPRDAMPSNKDGERSEQDSKMEGQVAILTQAGPVKDSQSADGTFGEEAARAGTPPGDFRLAPPAKASPWNTPRLGPQAPPFEAPLLQDLDGHPPWSSGDQKRPPPAPSPLFNFARGSGPSPTFTPLPGADATEQLDFLPLPSAALPSLAQGDLARPSSSPALAPHPRAALPPLAEQLHLMEEDTRSEPGDIARFRTRQLARTASLDGGGAERPLGGRQLREGGPPEEPQRAQERGAGKGGSEEEVWNSEEEALYFSDVEAVVLDLDLEPDDETGDAARRRARRLQTKYRKAMLRLEQMADAATCRQLTRERALAVLYGRRLRYLIRDSEILVGRSTVDASVDVDLAVEGPATKVSRKQASIKLKKDGNWYIKNLGKREFQVNNRPVEAGNREKLENKCLLEIGGLRLVFEINSKLVAKVLSRMPPDQ